jgi:hypothetical protein
VLILKELLISGSHTVLHGFSENPINRKEKRKENNGGLEEPSLYSLVTIRGFSLVTHGSESFSFWEKRNTHCSSLH